MNGIGFSKTFSYILNRLDVFGSIIVIIRFGYLYYDTFNKNNKNVYFLIKLFMSLCLNLISEYDKYNIDLTCWHISIFYLMNTFLETFVY
jgi:hypothetical protein